jgi:hypothetical protein
MLSVTYTSIASHPFDDEGLAVLLMNSRASNRRLGLTGFLLYQDGRFLQLLEGPDDVVWDRLQRIAADPRHHTVTTILRDPIATRQFPEWTMGYEPVTDALADEISGYRRLVDSTSLDEAAPAVRQVVAWFHARRPTAVL